MASRAAPETEPPTNDAEKIQPIRSLDDGNGCCVVLHNGAVSNRIYLELKDWADKNNYKYTSNIDSEAIIVSYLKHNKNMKTAFEYLSGGFACLLYDEKRDLLYVVNDHMQISHGYSRTIGGFILHSDNDAITQIIKDAHGVTKNGLCTWENYYNHYLDGGYIRMLDLDSGFMSKEKYRPRYIVGNTFDSSLRG